MRDFRTLAVWRKAHELVLDTYQWTLAFPKDEIYGLTSQMRRAAVSIGANIAEGCGREGDPERARFLRISMVSASESSTIFSWPMISIPPIAARRSGRGAPRGWTPLST